MVACVSIDPLAAFYCPFVALRRSTTEGSELAVQLGDVLCRCMSRMARFQHKLAALHRACVALHRSTTEGRELVAEAGKLGDTLCHVPGTFAPFSEQKFPFVEARYFIQSLSFSTPRAWRVKNRCHSKEHQSNVCAVEVQRVCQLLLFLPTCAISPSAISDGSSSNLPSQITLSAQTKTGASEVL